MTCGNVQTFDTLCGFLQDNTENLITASNLRDMLISLWGLGIKVTEGSNSVPNATTITFDPSYFILSGSNPTASVTLNTTSFLPAIGDVISGGTPTEVLYIDGSNELAQSPYFTFDDAASPPQLTVGGNFQADDIQNLTQTVIQDLLVDTSSGGANPTNCLRSTDGTTSTQICDGAHGVTTTDGTYSATLVVAGVEAFSATGPSGSIDVSNGPNAMSITQGSNQSNFYDGTNAATFDLNVDAASYSVSAVPGVSGTATDGSTYLEGIITSIGTGGGGTGSVTSVGLSTNASWLTVGSSPVSTSGTITIDTTTGLDTGLFLATPSGSSGSVGLRAITAQDISGGTGAVSYTLLHGDFTWSQVDLSADVTGSLPTSSLSGKIDLSSQVSNLLPVNEIGDASTNVSLWTNDAGYLTAPVSLATQVSGKLPVIDIGDGSGNVSQWNNDAIYVGASGTVVPANVAQWQTAGASPTISDTGITTASLTIQGNTFNAANKLIQADSGGRFPAMDGFPIYNLNYQAQSPGNWASAAPNTIWSALDRIASLLVTLNGGSPIP